MPPGPSHQPPGTDPQALAQLRGDLAGWTVEAVADLLGPVAHAALGREQPVPAGRVVAARPDDAVAVLTGLFVLGTALPRRAVDRALPTLGTTGAQQLRLLEAAGHDPDDEVRALVDLRPIAVEDAAGAGAWWVASDLGDGVTGEPLHADHVLGIGGASLTLAAATVRRRVGRALDLGTGCGIQALQLARHTEAVVATDLSGRAAAMARFNLALNRVDRVDVRTGDLLGPVAGERFDLVVSNPPFVITPRTGDVRYTYRDAGRAGDDVVAALVRDLPGLLTPGGVVQMLGNWEHRAGEGWRDRVAGWLDAADRAAGRPLDAWVVQREVQDPAQYAETWIRDGGHDPSGSGAGTYRAWLDDFEARGVEAVGFGLVTLRLPARERPGWRRVEEVRTPSRGPVGPHVERVLDVVDLLHDPGSDAPDGGLPGRLLASRLRVADDVRLESVGRPGADDPELLVLRQGAGWMRVVAVSTQVAAVVGACDGELPVGVLCDAVADLLGEDQATVRAAVLPVLADLTVDGLLDPA